MEQNSKRKSKYALMLVHEKSDGTIKKHTINSVVVEIAAVVLFILVVVITCKFVYDSIIIKEAKKEIVNQIVTINNLTDENEALSVENSTLSSKVAILSETVSKKTEVEDAISQETIENAMPKGFPLSGSATMKEAEEGEPMLIFIASGEVNVIGRSRQWLPVCLP